MSGLEFTGLFSGPEASFTSNITDMAVTQSGGVSYLYTTTPMDGGVTVFSLSSNDMPNFQSEYSYSRSEQAPGVAEISFLEYGGQTNFVAYGRYDWTLDAMTIQTDGGLGASTELNWGAGGVGNLSAVTSVEINGTTHVYGANAQSTGFNHYTIDGSNTLNLEKSYSKGGANDSADIIDLVPVEVDGQTILISAGQTSNALTSYRLDANGKPVKVTEFLAEEHLPVSNPTGMVTGQVDGQQYMVLASAGSSSLTVFGVESDGTLQPVDHVIDNKMTRFQNVTEITSVEVDGQMYIVAGGADDGLSLFTLGPSGDLILLDTIADSNETALQNISSLTAEYVDGEIQVFATSATEDGITCFTLDVSDVGETITGESNGEALSGGGQADVIDGGFGDDRLQGNAGDDILIDGLGADTLTGGVGEDVFVLKADDMTDTITDFEVGVDTIDLSGYVMLYDAGQIEVASTSWGATLTYRNEVLQVHSSDGSSLNSSHFTTTDMLALDRPPSGFFYLPKTFDGTDGADVLQGGGGFNKLYAGAGDDRLMGSDGIDFFYGGSGHDVVSYEKATQSISFDLMLEKTSGKAAGDKYFSIEEYVGSKYHDTMAGDNSANHFDGFGGNDNLLGFGGNDTLNGGAGNDTLEGGSGRDVLNGGAGHDIASYASATSAVQISLATGKISGSATGDTLISIEGVYGTIFDDSIDGNSENNTIYGLGGSDTLSGGAGNDKISGGDDDDTLIGGTGNDLLKGDDLFIAGSGADTLKGGKGIDSITFGSATKGVDMSLQSGGTGGVAAGDKYSSIEEVFGSDFNDKLGGNSSDNFIVGAKGNDTLSGEKGSDMLNGGDGNDQLFGGAGNDILSGGLGNSTLDGGSGDDLILYSHHTNGVGVDLEKNTTWGDVANDKIRGVEQITTGKGADELYGNAADNIFITGKGDDYLDGRGGNDQLLAGDGNDTLVSGEGSDVYDGGDGIDTLIMVANTSAATINLLDGSTGRSMKADKITNIENLEGTRFNDLFYGDNQMNVMFGNGGADTIYGGGGNDKIDGGGGNDVLYGSSGINRLTGGTGNDTMYGGTGRDFMIAGAGSDHYDGGDGFDTVSMTDNTSAAVVNLGTGIGSGRMAGDTFKNIEKINGTLFADRLDGGAEDNAFFGARGNDMLSGNDGEDFLVGAAGDDTIHGGTGNDRLNGGAGGDKMYGGTGDDTLVGAIGKDFFDGGDGIDTVVMDKCSYGADVWLETGKGGGSMGKSTFSNIENLAGTLFNDNLYGSSEANTLFGNDGADRLSGEGGDDFLVGGNGNDRLNGGVGKDRLVGGNGKDTLDGGEGNDVMIGGEDADQFIFSGGNDSIKDFNMQEDVIEISKEFSSSSGADILSYGTITSEGAVFNFGNGDRLLIEGITDMQQLNDSVQWS